MQDFRVVVLCILQVLLLTCNYVNADANSVTMKVVNFAGDPIELFWIDTFTSRTPTLVPQTKKPLRNTTETSINSYEGHQFCVRFLRHVEGTEVNFTVGAEEATFKVTWDAENHRLKFEQKNRYSQAIEELEQHVQRCSNDKLAEDPSDCVTKAIMEEVSRLQNSRSNLRIYRDAISARLRNYTCEDDTMETTKAIDTYKYRFLGRTYDVDVLLDLPNAKIWTVRNFITPQECEYIIKDGRPRLSRAEVSGSDGGGTYSESRKAQQATYYFSNDKEAAREEFLWPLYDRILKMVNYHSHYNLLADGQEGMNFIQYNPGDEYTPHCDGTCDGTMYKKFGRVASAVSYCEVPEAGGATTFSNSDIFIKPVKYSTTFFSYKGSNGKMDDGHTQHSGCPVRKGEKWIVTAWLREGVSNGNPWELYDPNGIPVLNMDDVPNHAPGTAPVTSEESHDEL